MNIKVNFNKYKIKTQIKIVLLILLLSCIIFGLSINSTLNSSLNKNIDDYTEYVTNQFSKEVDYMNDRVKHIQTMLFYDDQVESMLTSPVSYSGYDLMHHFSPISGTYTEVIDIALSNHSFHYSTLHDNFTLNRMSYLLQKGIKNGLGLYKTYSKDHAAFNGDVIAFGYPLYGTKDKVTFMQHIGDVILSINPDIALPIQNTMNTAFILIDANKYYHVFENNISINEDIINLCLSKSENLKNVSYIKINSSPYVITISYSTKANCYLASVVDTSSFIATSKKTHFLILSLWIILIVFIGLLMLMVNNNLVRPLLAFHKFMNDLRNGNRKNKKNQLTLNGSIEMYSLGKEFTELLNEMDILNHQLFQTTTNLYEMELEKQHAEIAHLRSQINPHFLYNTLELMKGISLEYNAPYIPVICNSMGKMFRYSIKGNPTALFSEELDIVKAYIQIQSIRFSDRFKVIYNISANTNNVEIMKMILQPIVENSIIHGLENKAQNGILYISSQIREDNLLITIQDNGIGMDNETLTKLKNSLTENIDVYSAISHIGISNINRRIKLQYGNEYGLSIDSVLNEGTITTITLPKGTERILNE